MIRGKANTTMKILTFTSLFPNNQQVLLGNFIKERVKYVSKRTEVRVVAPIPYFPFIDQLSHKWNTFLKVKHSEMIDDLEVYHPRYFMTPKVGMFLYGVTYYLSVRNFVTKLRLRYCFDIIDAHWAYPDGFAAVMLGQKLGVPVVLSLRGSDINKYLTFPLIRKEILFILNKATKIISVSNAIKEKIISLGIEDYQKISVIPNGIDTDRFYIQDKVLSRKKLNLPTEKKILLTVGHLVENKGFHIIIDAVNEILKIRKDILLIIIGNGIFRKYIENQIHKLGIDKHVMLLGQKPNNELSVWYSSADIFCLASQTEGCPNVLIESIACGTPVVATDVGGVSEIVTSSDYGRLLNERKKEAFVEGILSVLEKKWNKSHFNDFSKNRTWDNVADKLIGVFEST